MPESGTINETYHVDIGDYVDISPVLTPADATTLYEVSSDNPHVASIGTTGGHTGIRIQGVNAGAAVITIRGCNNLIMTTNVTVGTADDRPHEKKIHPAIPPTCIRPGLTESVTCSACRYVFTEAQETPPTGHNFGNWTILEEATANRTGLKERVCSNCGHKVTETIPKTGSSSTSSSGNHGGSSTSGSSTSSGSSSSSSGSGNSGGSSSSGGGSVTPSPTKKTESVAIGNQNITASVENGTIEASATNEQIAAIIADSTAKGVVEIDASKQQNVSEIKLGQNMVSAVHGSEKVSGLSISMNSGNINLSGDALRTVSDTLNGSNDSITFKIDKIDMSTVPATQKYPISNALNSAVFVELSALVVHQEPQGGTSTEKIREFNGNVTVSIPFERPAKMEGRQIIACHIADDGAITYFPVKYENGVAVFTTTHFSKFGIITSLAAAFNDIDINAWYMTSVEYVLSTNLMNGYDESIFAPNTNLSRAQLAQILYNKAGKPVVNGNSGFTDVSSDEWCSSAITWAAAKGIVLGDDNGLFNPSNNITREQLAVMLWRYAGAPTVTNVGLRFKDANTVSNYALAALYWAVDNDIINGIGNGNLEPKGYATRAQVAQMLKNYPGK